MHRVVVELRLGDAVGACEVEDLGRTGDPREVRTVADLPPAVALELREELSRPGDLVLGGGDRPSLTGAHCDGGVRQILPVMPNSALTAVASLNFSALEPTVGPSMALGR